MGKKPVNTLSTGKKKMGRKAYQYFIYREEENGKKGLSVLYLQGRSKMGRKACQYFIYREEKNGKKLVNTLFMINHLSHH